MNSDTPPAQPIYFGPPDCKLFGWFHLARSDTHSRLGLVLCNPFGAEAASTHRTYRQCAEMAAEAGIPALRFDYAGTGDSAGNDLDPRQLESWVASACAAAETLVTEAGVVQICLLGVRLGALIAGLAAARCTIISSLITVAAVVRGRAYARELRALSAAGATSAPPATQAAVPDLLEAAGYALTADTLAALATQDLLTVKFPAVRHAYVLHRPAMPPDEAFVRHLEDQRIVTQQDVCEGYAEMLLDPHDALVPKAAVTRVMNWLAKLQEQIPAEAISAPRQAGTTSRSAVVAGLRESAAFLDAKHRVFGIVTAKEPAQQKPGAALLLINSGAVHHIGPNRLYVTLARDLASPSLTVIRLDICGLGDGASDASAPRAAPYPESAVADVASAVEYCRRELGCADVHLAGICSGGYHSLKAAARGAPVSSITVINPLTFFWKPGMSLAQPEYQVTSEASRYGRRVWQPAAWLKVISGRVDVLSALGIVRQRTLLLGRHARRELARLLRVPLQDDLAAELNALAVRKTRISFVFSLGDPGLKMLGEQGGRTVHRLQQRSALAITILDGADHTFTTYWTRGWLTETLRSQLADASHR